MDRFSYKWPVQATEVRHAFEFTSNSIGQRIICEFSCRLKKPEVAWIDARLEISIEFICYHHGEIEVCAQYFDNSNELEVIFLNEKLKTSSSAVLPRLNAHESIELGSSQGLSVDLEVRLEAKNTGTTELSADLEKLFTEKHFSDVTLVSSDGKEIHAHWLILASRSPVFARMYQVDMLEKSKGRIEIADLDGSTLEMLLHYVYTGKVPEENKDLDWSSILLTAEKYQLKELRDICMDKLVVRLSVNSASELLILADLVGAEDVKVRALDFVIAHKDEVIATESYSELVRFHLHLVEDIFRRIATKR